MTLRARLVELLVGDPPPWPAAARDRAELNLLGLRVPALATAFLLLACALLMLDRNYDVLPRFGPIDPRSLRNQGIERLVCSGSCRWGSSSPSARIRGATGSGAATSAGLLSSAGSRPWSRCP